MAKKVLSIALALLMVVNVFAVAVSATVWTTEEAVITLKTDNAKPQPGDVVTVTVALQNNYNVHALQIMLAYDKGYYEVVGSTADEVFTDLLADDTAELTGVVQSQLSAAAQEEMYAGLYSAEQKAQFGLLKFAYVWLPSLGAVNAHAAFAESTDLVSFKLKVKDNAPTDGKGVIMVDPTFVVAEGVDTPAFDVRSATYVGKGTTTIADSAVNGKLYGLPINVDGAKFEGCVHVAGDAVTENNIDPDCTTAGSYDTVVYCSICGDEMSRTTNTVAALGHTKGEAVEENRVEATATEDGSYDMVVYCTVCGEELSRESFVIEALGHTPGEEVVENRVEADCVNDGSYDVVVYCTCCTPAVELSRKTITIDALGHTEAEAVEENRVDATPTVDGSYDMVVYCTVCGEELSRTTETIPALGHTPGEEVEENRVEADCVNDGSYDVVVYCTCCTPAVELSRKTITIDALGHTPVTDEAKAPTCTERGLTEGSHCDVCGEVLVAQEVVEALGHTEAEAVEENRIEATMDEDGSYDMVVYCSVCGEELSRETFVIPSLGAGPADYTALNALREEAAAIDRTAYTDESLDALDAVLAKITDDMKLPQQNIVDGWAEELADALKGLERDASKATVTVTTVLNKKAVTKDDIITVTIKLDSNYYIGTFQLPVMYDKTKFEIVGGGVKDTSYLTFNEDSALMNGSYKMSGSTIRTTGFDKTSAPASWNTEEAKNKYAYAWITGTPDSSVSNYSLAMPKDDTFVSFQVKALADVEDATESIFISTDWAKTTDNKAGNFVIGFAPAADEKDPLAFVSTGINYATETIAKEGVAYTGTVQSFATSTDNGDELTTIELLVDGEVKYSTTVAGVGTQNFVIEGVEAGTYTVRVSKLSHATREYTLEVVDEAIEEELKIHLIGDINGDGKINVQDYSRTLRHVKKTALLEGYEFDCADIDGNDKLNVQDYSRSLKHVKKTALLW